MHLFNISILIYSNYRARNWNCDEVSALIGGGKMELGSYIFNNGIHFSFACILASSLGYPILLILLYVCYRNEQTIYMIMIIVE